MARRRKSKTEQRDASVVARFPAVTISRRYESLSPLLREIEDRREFHPEQKERPARLLSQPMHRLEIKKPKGRKFKDVTRGILPWRIGFQHSNRVAVCVRRHRRREVLFAIRRAGRNSSRRRRTWLSDIHC